MGFTLHRYVFRELLKVFVLAVVALTLILSLGSILQPVQSYGVGPVQVMHLMVYFLPITLTFVLPMAALFASALVYGRLASDNEIDACKASGISLLTLAYPGLALAILVAIGNLVLSFHVMPYFVHMAERSLKADAKQILFRNIQRRGYYELPPDKRYLIYADEANLQTDTLTGVVVVHLLNRRIDEIISTESAKIGFVSHEKYNEVHITASNTHQMDADGTLSLGRSSFSVEFGSLLGDDIKFKNIEEMKRIRADLMRFYPVAKLAGEIYSQFYTELLAQEISDKLAGDPNGLYRLYSGTRLVDFRASGCSAENEKRVKLSGDVLVMESDASGGAGATVLRSPKAVLYLEGEELTPTLTMDIYNATEEASGDLRMRHLIRGLIPPKAVSDYFETGNILQEIAPERVAAGLKAGPSARLRSLEARLRRKIRSTLAEIKAETHSRLVFGIGCVPMILIGIGLGVIKRGGHLLSAFGASCIPAAVLIVCIVSGKHITENLGAQRIPGVALMWAGLVVLLLVSGVLYRILLRH